MTRLAYYRIYRASMISVALVLVSVSTAASQSSPDGYGSWGPARPPVPPYPIEMGYSHDHSSTLFESWQRGRGALIQAHGNFLLSGTQAQIQWEQARAMNRENKLKLREVREQIKEEQAAERVKGLEKLAERRSTVYRSLYQLSADQFDLSTGEIRWPAVLQNAKYEQVRERVGELFRTHISYGEPQPSTAEEIARTIEPLKRALQKDVANMPREDYIAGQKFLLGLKYQAMSLVQTS